MLLLKNHIWITITNARTIKKSPMTPLYVSWYLSINHNFYELQKIDHKRSFDAFQCAAQFNAPDPLKYCFPKMSTKRLTKVKICKFQLSFSHSLLKPDFTQKHMKSLLVLSSLRERKKKSCCIYNILRLKKVSVWIFFPSFFPHMHASSHTWHTVVRYF